MNRETLYVFLAQHKYGVVSSISKQGQPESALVGIAITENLEIIFDTVKQSRKYSNLIQHPHCSLVVGWDREQTLQFEGLATEPEGADLERYLQIYFEVWPECRTHLAWAGIVHMVVRPRWIRFSDYDQRPPLIEELTFY